MVNQKTRSVLIVEDERIVAKDLQETLAGLGYDAFAIASSADEAILRASDRCPDVVLMDIRIKGKRDGIETAEVLKQRFGVPVVYLTAHADDATIERAKLSEPHGYLLKPVKSAELRSAIEVAIYRADMEKRLRERERWYATTLRSISDAVMLVDLAGNITFMNPVAESLIGVNAAEVRGRPARDVLRLRIDGSTPVPDHPLDRALRERRAVEVREATLERSREPPLIISDSAAPVIDDGELLGAVMVFRDVTAQRTLEKQLELHDRLTSLGTMAAGVAHEINNPLAMVVGNSDYLLEALGRLRAELVEQNSAATAKAIAVLDEALECERDVRSGGLRIARIVSDLRAFSRPPSDGGVETNVARAIEWAVRTTSNELRHRARMTVDAAPDLPEAKVDETRLGQVLVNLIVNAAQAIDPGHPAENEITVTARATGARTIAIEVRDTGCGMPPEVMARIFEPFFTTKKVGGGTGLGLSVCHGIVRSFGGNLQVESQVGKGTLFRLTVPVAPPRGSDGPAPSPVTRPFRGHRILVVDDEEAVLRVIRRALDDGELVCKARAIEAFELLQGGEIFDVILCDLMMPQMSGIDLYERLLAIRPEQAGRIIFMTGGALTDRAADFLRTVLNSHVDKPFQVSTLREAVQRLIKP